eukprot:3207405-Pyramimonas_sp.AAC.2
MHRTPSVDNMASSLSVLTEKYGFDYAMIWTNVDGCDISYVMVYPVMRLHAVCKSCIASLSMPQADRFTLHIRPLLNVFPSHNCEDVQDVMCKQQKVKALDRTLALYVLQLRTRMRPCMALSPTCPVATGT